MSGSRVKRRVVLVSLFAGALALAVAAGCGPDDDEPAAPTCAELAAHLERICPGTAGAFLGEQVRVDCAAFPSHFGPDVRRCAMQVASCDRDGFDACDLSHPKHACTQPAECPAPLKCDTGLNECRACLMDTDCPSDRACLEGLCMPR